MLNRSEVMFSQNLVPLGLQLFIFSRAPPSHLIFNLDMNLSPKKKQSTISNLAKCPKYRSPLRINLVSSRVSNAMSSLTLDDCLILTLYVLKKCDASWILWTKEPSMPRIVTTTEQNNFSFQAKSAMGQRNNLKGKAEWRCAWRIFWAGEEFYPSTCTPMFPADHE